MGHLSHIEWTHHSFNPWKGCTAVSEACAHCYAETFSTVRRGLDNWGAGKVRVRAAESTRRQPFAWSREALRMGGLVRVFTNAHGDVNDADKVQRRQLDEWRAELYDETMAGTLPTPTGGGGLVWLLLSKRKKSFLPDRLRADPAVWEGFTAEKQVWFDRRWGWTKDRGPTRTVFVSIEPMLGRIVLPSDFLARGEGAGVLCGGESVTLLRHTPRPTHIDDVRYLRDQCAEAGVPFHFKQWGSLGPTGADRRPKKDHGRMLDGVLHSGMPPSPYARRPWIERETLMAA